ncbi:MAG TPA: hypothetical protein VNO30_25965 [Kofleriaceae bacterium]|nr:hypothetical protein [Kofleriaceae bacterium]
MVISWEEPEESLPDDPLPIETRWAILGKVPVDALNAARDRIPEFFRADGATIMSGRDGMSALLVFGGPAREGVSLASALSEEHRTPVFLLDFYEYIPGIWRFDGARREWQEGHPAMFLKSHGITPLGYESLEQSLVITIGVIEDATLEQARHVLPEARQLFTANARGVLVRDVSGMITGNLAAALNRRDYMVFYDQRDQSFLCTISEPGWSLMEGFSLGGWPTANCKIVDSILGESTIEGILRVLDIPRHLLFPN